MSRRKRSSKCTHERNGSKGKPTAKFRIGPITRNPFLNFLRDMRKAARIGMTVTEITARGAELWRKMNAHQKKPYCELAKQVPKVNRRKGSRSHRQHRSRRKQASESDFSSKSCSIASSRDRSSRRSCSSFSRKGSR